MPGSAKIFTKVSDMRFETKAIYAGLNIHNPSRSIVPPISPSTIYEISEVGRDESDLHYTRLGNPNWTETMLEPAIEELENALETGVWERVRENG